MNQMLKIAAGIFTLILLVVSAAGQASYVKDVEKWRAEHLAELVSDDGWLTVAGLFWLKEGVNTVGSGDEYDVQLTPNFKQGKFGDIEFHGGAATLKVAPGVKSSAAGKPVAEIQLVSDEQQKQTVIDVGSQTFYLVKRGGRYGIRLKDKASLERTAFKRLNWYPVDRSYRIIADYEPYAAVREVEIANALGGVFRMKAPGILRFKIRGKEFTLQPVVEGDKLFIIFRDWTSKTETYGSGRYLYAAKAMDGKVVLDFNKAENPPCAFTPFATCPLPPRQNRLDAAIKAGEKRYHP